MPMFSFNKSSYESNLMKLLQERFFQIAWRNKIIAKWVAGRLGYKGAEMNTYVRNFIFAYLAVPSDRKMIDRILVDFEEFDIPMTEEDVVNKIKSVEERMKTKADMMMETDNAN